MKKVCILIGCTFFALTAGAQTEKKEKKEIRKEVSVEEVNGVKTMVVTTTENGKVTSETFQGEEADKKIAEMEKEEEKAREEGKNDPNKKVSIVKEVETAKKSSNSKTKSEVSKEVKVTEENGVKKVTVTTLENGKESIEVFEGEAADKKLKEFEAKKSTPGQKKVVKKTVTKEGK